MTSRRAIVGNIATILVGSAMCYMRHRDDFAVADECSIVAIWDNRCCLHIPTRDQTGKRLGFRVLSVGETPYYDPKSVSKLEAQEALNPGSSGSEEWKTANLLGVEKGTTKDYRWSA